MTLFKECPQIIPWLTMTQAEVLAKFHGLPDAFSDGKGQKKFVYVPGTRKDRTLLVAHSDTVWGNVPIEIDQYNGVIFSKKYDTKLEFENKWGYKQTMDGIGIGADDRAGCAILWHLRNLGHSLLVTSGEESGCIASKFIINSKWWQKELNDTHQFAVEFDRRGQNDIVFYNVGTNKFADYVKKQTGYKPQSGSLTDIRELCLGMCGVNLSVGYYSEHTANERLVVDQWMNTLGIAYEWLSKPDLPRFDLDKKDLFYPKSTWTYYGEGWDSDDGDWIHWTDERGITHYGKRSEGASQTTTVTKTKKSTGNKAITTPRRVRDFLEVSSQTRNLIKCPHCSGLMTQEAWFEAFMKCIHCNKGF